MVSIEFTVSPLVPKGRKRNLRGNSRKNYKCAPIFIFLVFIQLYKFYNAHLGLQKYKWP